MKKTESSPLDCQIGTNITEHDFKRLESVHAKLLGAGVAPLAITTRIVFLAGLEKLSQKAAAGSLKRKKPAANKKELQLL